MAEFPEAGKYTIETLPANLPAGKHQISLNGKNVTLFVVSGIPYLNQADTSEIVGLSQAGLGHRMRAEKAKIGRDLRCSFGGLEKWTKLEDIKRLFFTPRTEDKPTEKKKSAHQKEWQQ